MLASHGRPQDGHGGELGRGLGLLVERLLIAAQVGDPVGVPRGVVLVGPLDRGHGREHRTVEHRHQRPDRIRAPRPAHDEVGLDPHTGQVHQHLVLLSAPHACHVAHVVHTQLDQLVLPHRRVRIRRVEVAGMDVHPHRVHEARGELRAGGRSTGVPEEDSAEHGVDGPGVIHLDRDRPTGRDGDREGQPGALVEVPAQVGGSSTDRDGLPPPPRAPVQRVQVQVAAVGGGEGQDGPNLVRVVVGGRPPVGLIGALQDARIGAAGAPDIPGSLAQAQRGSRQRRQVRAPRIASQRVAARPALTHPAALGGLADRHCRGRSAPAAEKDPRKHGVEAGRVIEAVLG